MNHQLPERKVWKWSQDCKYDYKIFSNRVHNRLVHFSNGCFLTNFGWEHVNRWLAIKLMKNVQLWCYNYSLWNFLIISNTKMVCFSNYNWHSILNDSLTRVCNEVLEWNGCVGKRNLQLSAFQEKKKFLLQNFDDLQDLFPMILSENLSAFFFGKI